MKKIGELGFYDIYTSGWWIFRKIRYEINYSRIDWEKVGEDYRQVVNE